MGLGKMLGKAHWILDADSRKLRAEAKAAKKNIQDLGDETVKSGKRMQDSFANVGSSLEKIQSVLGKALIPVALIGAIGGMVSKFVQARKEAEAFTQAMQKSADQVARIKQDTLRVLSDSLDPETQSLEEIYKISKAAQDEVLAKLDEELDKREEIRKVYGSTVAFIKETASGISVDELAEQASDAIKKIDAETQKAIEARRRANKKQQELEIKEAAETADKVALEFAKAADRQSEKIAASLLPDKEQIKALADLARAEFEDAAASAGLTIDNQVVTDRLRLIDQEEQRKLSALKERLALERASQKKAAEESAKAFANEMAATLEPLFRDLTTSFGEGFTTQLSQISLQIEEVVNEARKGRR